MQPWHDPNYVDDSFEIKSDVKVQSWTLLVMDKLGENRHVQYGWCAEEGHDAFTPEGLASSECLLKCVSENVSQEF